MIPPTATANGFRSIRLALVRLTHRARRRWSHRLLSLLLVLLALVATADALASVSINGTRVVYSEDQREQTIHLDNRDSSPVLVQAWADDFAGTRPARDASSPFLVTPAVFRLDPGDSQTLRIMRIRDASPTDQESLYWLNIKEVPPIADTYSNALQLGILNRLKFFYRPQELDGNASDAIAQLRWHLEQDHGQPRLVCDNPSDFHVSLVGATWDSPTAPVDITLDTVPPHGERSWPLSRQLSARSSFWYQAINDYGAVVIRKASLARH